MEQSPSQEPKSHSASQEVSCLLWNPQRFITTLQQPTTGPYHEPDESSPHPIKLSLYDPV